MQLVLTMIQLSKQNKFHALYMLSKSTMNSLKSALQHVLFKRFASETFTYEVIRLRKTNLYNAFKIEQRFLKLMKKQGRKYVPSKDTMSAGHTECFI